MDNGYTITEANWRDLPQIEAYRGTLEDQAEELRARLDRLTDFISKLKSITHWQNGTPFRILDKGYAKIVINLKTDKWAEIYKNARSKASYGVYLKDYSVTPYTEKWLGSDFTVEEATRLGYDYVGFAHEKGDENATK